MTLIERIPELPEIYVRQHFEAAGLIGLDSRNRYTISGPGAESLGRAEEKGRGIAAFFRRNLLNHWRSFDIDILDRFENLAVRAHHPFRWYFIRLEVRLADGTYLGALQRRFSILSKKFDVEDPQGQVIMTVDSPVYRLWSFNFEKSGRKVARLEKKWSGLLTEVFTDKDRFRLSFEDPGLSRDERLVLLASTLFIDLMYFHRNQTSLMDLIPTD